MEKFSKINELKELLNKGFSPIQISRRKEFLTIYNSILNYKNKLSIPKDSSIHRVFWHIFNGPEIPLCKTCKKKRVSWRQRKHDYQTFCSSKCSMSDPNVKIKYNKSIKDNFGVDSIFQSEEIKEKSKKTLLDKFGVEHAMQNPELKQKALINSKNSLLTKYGQDNPSKIKKFKEKRDDTFNKKYGGNPLSCEHIRDKIKNTNLTKYGVNNTFLIKKSLKNKKESSNKNSYNNMIDAISGLYEPMFNYEDYNGRVGHAYNFKCLKCEDIFLHKFNHVTNIPRCFKCYPYKKSKAEIEISDYLKSINQNFTKNTQSVIKPLELDFYIEDYNIAIEYNGLYWHSFDKKESKEEKNYHLNKTEKCLNKGIKLFHIFENEWINKKDIWKGIISNSLNLSKKVFGRKCNIKEVSKSEKSLFLNKNHLQGNDNSSIYFGLFLNNELVSIITIGKSRYNKKFEYEIHRFCSKIGINVIGGFSKLLKFFEKKFSPSSIITYADRRYSNGDLYRNNGFLELKSSSPNYFYLSDNKNLYSRLKFQKHKLSGQLSEYDSNLTEYENMFNNGYRRIWDCGNLVFKKHYE